MRIYLDTSIYDAAWLAEERNYFTVSSLFENLKILAIDCKYTIIASKYVEDEIQGKYPRLMGNWKVLFEELQYKMVMVRVDEKIINSARELGMKYAKLHSPDSLHLAIAVNYADVLVTYDLELEEIAKQEMKVKLLEELV